MCNEHKAPATNTSRNHPAPQIRAVRAQPSALIRRVVRICRLVGASLLVGLSFAPHLHGQTTNSTTNCSISSYNVNCQSYSETQKDFWTSFEEGMARGAYIRAANGAAALAQSQIATAQSERMAAVTRAQAERFDELVTALRSDTSGTHEPHLPHVNDSLALDFDRADRVEIRTRGDGGGGSHLDMARRFVVTRGLGGEKYIEVALSGKYSVRQGLRSRDVIASTGSSRLAVSAFNSFTFSMRQSPLVPELAERFSAVLLIGERAVVSSSTLSTSLAVPNGIIPLQVLRQTILSLPDSLPDALRFWVLDDETGRVTEAQMDRTQVMNKRVPIAAAGHSCQEQYPAIRDRSVEVAQYSLLIGAKRIDYFVLVTPPHIAWLSTEDLLCVSAPRWAAGR